MGWYRLRMAKPPKVTQLPIERDVQTITPEDVGLVEDLFAGPVEDPVPAEPVVRTANVDKIVSEALGRECGKVLDYLKQRGYLKSEYISAAHSALSEGKHR